MKLRIALGALSASLVLAAPLPAAQAAAGTPRLGWELKETGVTARLRGLSPVSRHVVWASGSGGTVLRTVDGGRTWQNVSPPDTATLQFRDIEAFDANRAVALSIGAGTDSRVYRTEDGGRTWAETFRNDEPQAFYDCMAFFDRRHGLAMSDPVNGRFRILATQDGGRSWQVLPPDGMPEALPGEAGFAASGQCLVAAPGGRDAWLASGGAERARVFHSRDRGHTWTVADTPILAGDPARGVFGLAFRDRHRGIAVGGDYRPEQQSPSAGAVSRDGGASWQPSSTPPPAYRSGVTWLPHFPFAAVAVGPSGSDVTYSGGRVWESFDGGSFDTVACTRDRSCWAAGEQGRVARLTVK
ncbi:WD40/YVTN/BNR-like repeat-containing protein [Nonomuraea gerenzanensis]|uniref:WD40/YVTN/BNR-like repeat-containing protein n=1 Tax=Nonomuraea gerenzanensis TaxID=93944 RepID=UPI001CD96984|nr:oxidoreductase [Nonomuraea gerenzanensis]UBU10164.1 oxidoreductase [Nonomuraea gerenzanensis]